MIEENLAGYTFTNWTEDVTVVSTSASYTFTISGNRTLVANFQIIQYTITASAGTGGAISPSGAVSVDYGSNQTFTITPALGYHVASVTVDGSYVGGVTSYTFTNVTAVHTITGQAPVDLGTSGRFAILSDQAITNSGAATSITGDVGQSPITGGAITGLTSGQVIGTIFAVDAAGPVGLVSAPAMLIIAKNDATNAYTDATAIGRGTPIPIVGNLANQTLTPGLYTQGFIDLSVGATFALDAQGDSSAVFIIRSASTIQLNDNSVVSLIGRAQARNIFWVAASAVTLNGGSTMKGTVIANTFSLLSGATLEGRALIPSGGAAASLIQNTIVLPQ